jgi:hypothetical protein
MGEKSGVPRPGNSDASRRAAEVTPTFLGAERSGASRRNGGIDGASVRSPRVAAVSVPTGHNLFGFLYRCQTPPQLGHLLSHRIFHDLFFLNSEDELLRGCAFERGWVKIDVAGSGPILL